MKILVTGSSGFMGRNLIDNLTLRPEHTVIPLEVGHSQAYIQEAIAAADIVFHFAGANRPKEEGEFHTVNVGLTETLLSLAEASGRRLPFVFSSSIHAARDTAYGRSKRTAEEAFFAYAQRTGAPVYVYRLPHAFGKWSRPNHNSVVATFCYNTVHGLPLRIDDPETTLTLVYIDDIVDECFRVLDGHPTPAANPRYCAVPVTQSISLGALAALIQGFARARVDLTHDYDRRDPLTRKLYATFMSYLPEDAFASPADMKEDARGFFAELLKSPYAGQISVSRTKPGITRGNHWHNTKVEKFIVVEGEALITFRRLDGKDVIAYPVSGKKIEIVDIPPGYTHAFENTGGTDLVTVIWAGELFDPDVPDTNFLEVNGSAKAHDGAGDEAGDHSPQ